MQICELSPESRPQLLQLPEECIREIILRLSDHRDLSASAEACEQMAVIVEEQRVWRELTKFHFSPQQIDLVLPKNCEKIDWKDVYHSLKRYFLFGVVGRANGSKEIPRMGVASNPFCFDTHFFFIYKSLIKFLNQNNYLFTGELPKVASDQRRIVYKWIKLSYY